MAITRDDIVTALRDVRKRMEDAAASLPKDDWSSGVYEGGWNAKQLLAHIASTSGVANFLLAMANLPESPGAASGGAPAFDRDAFDRQNDAFNRQQVGMRSEKSVEEMLDEIRSNILRDIQAVQAAPEELIAKHYRAPWGVEGTVGEVIIASLRGHLGTHVADLRLAASAGGPTVYRPTA